MGHRHSLRHGRVGAHSGTLAKGVKREDVQISTKFTPQIAEVFDNSVEKMAEASIERMRCDHIDIYWIHNPMDVERWTRD